MQKQTAALIVSGRLENRQQLSRILSSLPTDVSVVGTLAHAREVIAEHSISIVFCDERLSDGRYGDLVAFAKAQRRAPQFIVILSTGEWLEFLKALGMGADVIRCPLQPMDVELALIHALRKNPATNGSRTFAVSA